MKKLLLIAIISVLLLSLAAPAGAVFAMDISDRDEDVKEMIVEDQIATPIVSESDIEDDVTVSETPQLSPEQPQSEPATDQPKIEDEQLGIATDDPVQTESDIKDDRQIVIAGLRTTATKYVMLYNQSNTTYKARELTVRYFPATHGDFLKPTLVASFTGSIAPHSYVLIAQQSQTETDIADADATFTANILAQAGGTIQVVEDKDELALFCWGNSVLCGEEVYRKLDDGHAYQQCLNQNGTQQACRQIGVYKDFYIQTRTPYVGHGGFTPVAVNECETLRLSEIGANRTDQFIEIYNTGDTEVSLKGCQLQTKSSAATYVFGDETLAPRSFRSIAVADTSLRLVKTTTSVVYLLSSDGKTEVGAVAYNKLAVDTSWSLVDGEWRQTYAATPGEENVYQQFLPCDEGYWRNINTGRCNKNVEPNVLAACAEGKERNPVSGRCRNIVQTSGLKSCRPDQYRSKETNRCRKIAEPSTLKPCLPHQYRNPATNRCRSIVSAVSALKPCRDDQFRNPVTNRCKKIASTDDVALADCGEGRERNPLTNRCRNVRASAPPAADFAVEDVVEPASVFIGWWVLGGVALLTIGYAGWEWREEIGRFIRRIFRVDASAK